MDDKLPTCGCGGEAYIRWDGPAVWIECMQYGHIKTPKFSYLDQAKAAWTRAMSAQAPGMEAMLRECRPYVAMEAGEQDNNTVAEALTLLEQIDAVLQAAERVKA